MRTLRLALGLTVVMAIASLDGDANAQVKLPATAVCASGFTAHPTKVTSTGEDYTCTGPKPVCAKGFELQQISVTVPARSAGALPSNIMVPAVSIKDGRMVYTCAPPETPK